MSERVGLKIVDLIYDITQEGYFVQFYPDLNGMLRIHFNRAKPWLNEIDEHEHLGYPGCERKILEKAIIKSLSDFLKKLKSEEIVHA